jgi:hypothetical protein
MDYMNNDSFMRKNLEKKKDTFNVHVNEEERELLNACKLIIEQQKDSTALKTLAWIGAKVLHEDKTKYLIGILFKNKRNNKRLGIVDFD